MTNKQLIQGAVSSGHNGLDYIVETRDFISGAWYMLEYLKKHGMVRFEGVGDATKIHKILAEEGNENYKNRTT